MGLTYADILDKFENVSETYRDICFPEGFFAVNVKTSHGWGACYFKGEMGQEDAPMIGRTVNETSMFSVLIKGDNLYGGQWVTSIMDIFKEEN